jgi:hypothetical protein
MHHHEIQLTLHTKHLISLPIGKLHSNVYEPLRNIPLIQSDFDDEEDEMIVIEGSSIRGVSKVG